jgi:hypothetical protein
VAVWQWIAVGFAFWLMLSLVTGALWVAVARAWKARHRSERRRRGWS